MTNEGPMKDALDRLDTQAVYKHVLTTYRYVSGQLVVQTHSRRYSKDGDYVDSYSSEPIGRGSSV